MSGGLFQRYRVQGDPLRSERRVELVAVILGLLLLAVLAWNAVRLALLSQPETVAPAPDSLVIAAAAVSAPPAEQARAEIRGRPLFWAGRRPSRALDAAELEAQQQRQRRQQQASAQPIKGVKLVGIFGSGDSAGIIAIVRGEKRRMMVGEEVDGWKLKGVSAKGARFASRGSEQNLPLQRGLVELPDQPLPAEAAEPEQAPPPLERDGLKSFGKPG